MTRPGVWLLSSLLLLLTAGCGSEAPPPRPNVMLISIDTLRSDHLACYGYERETSPVLSRLAAGGVVFLNAYAPSPNTVPSHATMLTGRLPTQHQTFTAKNKLPATERTLAEELGEAGWRTFASTSSIRFHENSGFDQGFEAAHLTWRPVAKNDLSRTVVDRFVEELDRGDERPWFAFVHFLGPHQPYAPPEPFRSRWHPGLRSPTPETTGRYLQFHSKPGQDVPEETVEYLEALYDGEILYLDTELERLFGELERRGELDDTLVIVTSDHGEEFKEHGGLQHSHALHEELLRVPLIMYWPAGLPVEPGTKLERPARLADILPTVLTLLDRPLPPRTSGRPLFGEAPREPYDVVMGQMGETTWSLTATLPTGRFKLLVVEDQPPVLYRLDDDRLGQVEVQDRHARELQTLQQLAERLRPAQRPDAEAEDVDVDLEMRKQLEEMGYVDEV